MTEKEIYDSLAEQMQNYCKDIKNPAIHTPELIWKIVSDSFTAVALLYLINSGTTSRLPARLSDVSERVKKELINYLVVKFDYDLIRVPDPDEGWVLTSCLLPPLGTDVLCRTDSGKRVFGHLYKNQFGSCLWSVTDEVITAWKSISGDGSTVATSMF